METQGPRTETSKRQEVDMLPATDGLLPETDLEHTLPYSLRQTFVKIAQIQEGRTQTPHLSKRAAHKSVIMFNLSQLPVKIINLLHYKMES